MNILINVQRMKRPNVCKLQTTMAALAESKRALIGAGGLLSLVLANKSIPKSYGNLIFTTREGHQCLEVGSESGSDLLLQQRLSDDMEMKFGNEDSSVTWTMRTPKGRAQWRFDFLLPTEYEKFKKLFAVLTRTVA